MRIMVLILFVLLAAGDAWTTWRGLRVPGTYEASPLGRYWVGDGSSVLRWLVMKGILVAIFAYALFGYTDVAWVDALRWAIVAAMFGLAIYAVVNNIRIIRGGP